MMNPQSISEFIAWATKIRDEWFKKDDCWGPWFRGHERAEWPLCPKLYRPEFGGYKRIKNDKVEDEIREEFISRAPVLCEALPAGAEERAEWEWYFMMQHFGAPTRLLDWTEGALIALCFAVRNNPGSHDAAVWALDPYSLNKQVIGSAQVIPPSAGGLTDKDRRLVRPWLPDRFKKRKGLPARPIAVYPAHVARRISTQRSCFTVHGSEEAALDEFANAKKPRLVKVVIPSSSILAIKMDLRACGIDDVTIFPDLDGLCRSISARWQIGGKTIPHERVYARIQPSKIHGVGLFAIRDIPNGTGSFPQDESELHWIKKSALKVDKLPQEIKRLYNQFCLIEDKGQTYGCPKNFNLMTVSWYLNHSKTPNVGCDENYNFFALRHIKKGEELTADYWTYNEFASADWV